jgi:hypothetical protein
VSNLSERLNHWRRGKHLERVARWEHTRLKGKARYGARVTLIWSGSMIIFNGLWDYYFDRGIEIPKLIFLLIAGLIVSLVSWWDNEGVFKAAKIDERTRQARAEDPAHTDDAEHLFGPE